MTLHSGLRRARHLRNVLTFLLILAVAGFWTYFHLAPPGPMHLSHLADPEMEYFMNALAAFKGQPYWYVDHPGTPVEVLGSALLALTYPFIQESPAGFIAHHIRKPQLFMTLAHAVLLLATLASIVLLARLTRLRHWSDGLVAAAIPASFFAAYPQAFTSVVYWSHNSFAFGAGTLLMAGLLLALWRGRLRDGRLVLLGLAAGVLTATQLFFATWALAMALAIAIASTREGVRQVLRRVSVFASAAAAGFLVATLPMLPHYPRFLRFVGGLVTHQGLYGTGEPGFTTWRQWTSNLGALWEYAPVVFVVPPLAGVLALARRAPARRLAVAGAVAAGALVCWALLVFLLGKHPSRYYVPALAALLPVLLLVAHSVWHRRGGAVRVCLVAGSLAVFAGCLVNGAQAVSGHRQRLSWRRWLEAEVRRYVAADLGATRSGPPFLVWGPGMGDVHCYTLWYGNYSTNGAFSGEISAECPYEGYTLPRQTIVPHGAGNGGLVVTTDASVAVMPALVKAYGQPHVSAAAGAGGARLVFYRVALKEGRLVPR